MTRQRAAGHETGDKTMARNSIKVGEVRRLNRHIRGWGFVEVVALDDRKGRVMVDTVRDLETGCVYAACRRNLLPQSRLKPAAT
jgi:hypothetical protein